MVIDLDNARDAHFYYLHKYVKSTANIVIRTIIDAEISEECIVQSLRALTRKHPYLTGAIRELGGDNLTLQLEIDPTRKIGYVISESNKPIFDALNKPSKHLYTCFELDKGEQLKLFVTRANGHSLIELVSSHFVGDVTAIAILYGDIIRLLDAPSEFDLENICVRRCFSEERYGWDKIKTPVASLTLPVYDEPPCNPWYDEEYCFERFEFSINEYQKVSEWIKKNKIAAKPTDVFYFIANKILRHYLQKDINFWVIYSHRDLILNQEERNNINTEAAFRMIDVADKESLNTREWIESFYLDRKKFVSEQSMLEKLHFLRCFNKTLFGSSPKDIKDIMNSLVRFGDFAYNNYGKMDSTIGHPKNFSIVDADIHDATPMSEFRFFSYKNTVHLNISMPKEGPISPKEYFDEFFEVLNEIVTG